MTAAGRARGDEPRHVTVVPPIATPAPRTLG